MYSFDKFFHEKHWISNTSGYLGPKQESTFSFLSSSYSSVSLSFGAWFYAHFARTYAAFYHAKCRCYLEWIRLNGWCSTLGGEHQELKECCESRDSASWAMQALGKRAASFLGRKTLCYSLVFWEAAVCEGSAVPTGDARAAGADGVAVGAHGDGGVLLLLQRALLLHCAALHQGTHKASTSLSHGCSSQPLVILCLVPSPQNNPLCWIWRGCLGLGFLRPLLFKFINFQKSVMLSWNSLLNQLILLSK